MARFGAFRPLLTTLISGLFALSLALPTFAHASGSSTSTPTLVRAVARPSTARGARLRALAANVRIVPYADPTSRAHFGYRGVRAQRVGNDRAQASRRAAEMEMFGRSVEPEEYAWMVGAPDGSTVTVGYTHNPAYADAGERDISEAIEIRIEHSGFDVSHQWPAIEIYRDPTSGRRMMYLYHIFKHPENTIRAFGRTFMMQLIARARLAGLVDSVMLDAAGPDLNGNGSYTWTAMGFDHQIGETEFARLPESLRHGLSPASSFSDLLMRDGHIRRDALQHLSRELPNTLMRSEFILDRNSPQSRVHDAYLRDQHQIESTPEYRRRVAGE